MTSSFKKSVFQSAPNENEKLTLKQAKAKL